MHDLIALLVACVLAGFLIVFLGAALWILAGLALLVAVVLSPWLVPAFVRGWRSLSG